jgi:6-phosphogluconolactonase/glucosamine-6-phosphate isomerase/deaminase
MKIKVFADAESVARQAAALIAADARAAVAERDRFVMAISGGHTPWIMLSALAQEDIPWAKIHIAQVDERVAPAEHPDRNLTHLRGSLLEHASLPSRQIYAMPVEAPDLETAARQDAATLANLAGSRRILWLVTGSEKIGVLGRLLKADTSIPAERVSQDHAVLFADRAAAENGQPGRKDQEGVEQLIGQG